MANKNWQSAMNFLWVISSLIGKQSMKRAKVKLVALFE